MWPHITSLTGSHPLPLRPGSQELVSDQGEGEGGLIVAPGLHTEIVSTVMTPWNNSELECKVFYFFLWEKEVKILLYVGS